MDSSFLVFDLIAGNARVEVKGNTRNLIYAKHDHRKQAVGFIGREESQSGSGGDRFAEFNGSHRFIFRTRNSSWLYAIARIDCLYSAMTATTLGDESG
jgi:hypothetical protein